MAPSRRLSSVIGVSFCVILIMCFRSSSGQYVQSPCPDVFTYQLDPQTRQIFGYIEIPDLRVGQSVKVIVELSIPAQLTTNNYGSIALINSRKQTGKDILNGLPAQYKVIFPLRNTIPSVKSITLNGKIICSGPRANGQIVTTVRLQHTLETQFKSTSIVSQRVMNQQKQAPQIIALPKLFDVALKIPQLPQPVISNKNVCGKPVVGLTRFAINGKRTEKGQFPWIAPIFYKPNLTGEKPIYVCGSSLVTMRHLVTAGHCVFLEFDLIRPEKLLAAVGMHNIDNFFEDSAEFSGIQKIFPHPNYVDDDPTNELDIAVLQLFRTMPLTPHIIPICLWKGDDNLDKVVDMSGVVAGWGVTELGSTSTPNHFVARIVSKRQCSANLARVFSSASKNFCADGNGASPCNGDSGSGFAMLRGNQYFLRGIVSRGQVNHITLKCDISKYGIYMDIAPVRYWLRTIIG
ncbi:serine protease gd-like [Ochlerotatus camptorhynchus]|uniref:serine protease gd-like n=1 Tax=Ochlerotatus camptorhynchus TaxID=644619 RepID=UPI0031E418A8